MISYLAVLLTYETVLFHFQSHASHHHSHGHEEPAMEMKRGPLFSHLSAENIEESTYFDSTWKGLTALGGLYFMFLVEHVLTLIKQFKDKKKKVRLQVLKARCTSGMRLEWHPGCR